MLLCILLHVIPLPVVAVMRSGCKHAHQWNLILGVSPRLAVLMSPHAEDNVLVILLLLLLSSLIAPLVFFVLAPVLFSLTLIWFSCIRSLLNTYILVKDLLQELDTGFLVSEVFFSFPSLLAAVLALNIEQ